ncbi:MAG: hypothetical protein DA328_02225 [Nitrososphaeraceae archaeon]|nr:hypothetical protein [Nitrososphaeraceae archaeon]
MDIDSNIATMNQLENRYLFSQNKKHQTMNISKLHKRKYGHQGNLIIKDIIKDIFTINFKKLYG